MKSLSELYTDGLRIVLDNLELELKREKAEELIEGYREDLTFIDEEEALLYLIYNVYKVGLATGYQEGIRQDKEPKESEWELKL